MNTIDWNGKQVLISRTDSIGDVMLTLPLCAWLKEQFPQIQLTFLGKSYTAPILHQYPFVDRVLLLDDLEALPLDEQVHLIQSKNFDAIIHVFPRKSLARLAKKARIPLRIGTSHRLFHWTTCNVRLDFTRKNSVFHESQLNFELLRPFGLKELPQLDELQSYTQDFGAQLDAVTLPYQVQQPYVILHPKSQGSAREWPMESYVQLTTLLVDRGYTVCFTGTEKEGAAFRHLLPKNPHVIDTTGTLTMDQLLYLIKHSHGLVACSTGPLHLAGFLNVRTVGLFISKRPMHPGRWQPLGSQVITLVNDPNCAQCASKNPCNCIEKIQVEDVLNALQLS